MRYGTLLKPQLWEERHRITSARGVPTAAKEPLPDFTCQVIPTIMFLKMFIIWRLPKVELPLFIIHF